MIAFNIIGVVFLVTAAQCYNYSTNWFEVPLDHFSFQNNHTFKIKYLVNEDSWDRERGPIFFYTGNEGQIEVFAQHTGFMWEIAGEFRAKLVFAEHRYYGESMPFGNKSLDADHVGYLTSSQALADYADLIDYLQGHSVTPKYPVIAFGGSYGGMLSAYFRMKYPHHVDGAIAASAPIHMYPGMVPCDVFHRIVTSSYRLASKQCEANIRASWETLRNFTKGVNSSEWLVHQWRLCSPVKNATDVQDLIDFLQGMYENIAMVNYPFPSDFLMNLPANPVRVVCQYISEELKGPKLLEAIGNVLNVYANYDQKSKCVDYKQGDYSGNLDASGWDYQACSEMVMPMCTTGIHDMFEPKPWNLTSFAVDCKKKYNVTPRPNYARLEYGGDRLYAASNIVFSNGLLDPWAGGGILSSLSENVKAVIMPDTAHHLDLMPQNPADPASVAITRNIHKTSIREWIKQFHDQLKNNHIQTAF